MAMYSMNTEIGQEAEMPHSYSLIRPRSDGDSERTLPSIVYGRGQGLGY